MSIAWGDFDSMALHYIKMLSSPIHEDPVWIEDGNDGPYGVCSYQEFAQLVGEHGTGRYRPVSTMTRVEFMGLLLVRYNDFFPEESDGVEKEGVQTGEQPGGEHSIVDVRRDRRKEGGSGEGDGRSEEEDNNRKVH